MISLDTARGVQRTPPSYFRQIGQITSREVDKKRFIYSRNTHVNIRIGISIKDPIRREKK